MSPTHTRRSGKLYRYYISQTAMKRGSVCSVGPVPAGEIERIVLDQVRNVITTPEIIVQTWRAARKLGRDVTESEVRSALSEFEELWNELFPAEQARLLELLVQRVDVHPDHLDITFRIDGLTSLYSELRTSTEIRQAAE